jgi:integrase
VLSLEEAQALWKAVDADHVAMYLTLAFNTAARPDAILDLKASQIDCERHTVTLNPEGRKQTKKFRPVLPLTNDLETAVKGLSDPLVRWHGKPVANIKTGFRALRRRAGLDADVIPYTIRHTMATEMRAAGVSPWEVGGWLGHKMAELRTTERYAKASPQYMANARVAVDAYMLRLRSNAVPTQACVEPHNTVEHGDTPNHASD